MSNFLATVKFNVEINFKNNNKDTQEKRTQIVNKLFNSIDDLDDINKLKIKHYRGNTYTITFSMKGNEDFDEHERDKLSPEDLARVKIVWIVSEADSIINNDDDGEHPEFKKFIDYIEFKDHNSFEYQSKYSDHYFVPEETESHSSKRHRHDVDDLTSLIDNIYVSNEKKRSSSPSSAHSRKKFRAAPRSRSRSPPPPPIPNPYFGDHKGGDKTKRTISKKRRTQKNKQSRKNIK